MVGALQSMSVFLTCNPLLPDVIGVIKEVGPLGEITSKATNRTVSHDPLVSYLGFQFG